MPRSTEVARPAVEHIDAERRPRQVSADERARLDAAARGHGEHEDQIVQLAATAKTIEAEMNNSVVEVARPHAQLAAQPALGEGSGDAPIAKALADKTAEMEAFRAAGNDYCQKLQKAVVELKDNNDKEVARLTAELSKLQLQQS